VKQSYHNQLRFQLISDRLINKSEKTCIIFKLVYTHK
jgi:hypothetical protein